MKRSGPYASEKEQGMSQEDESPRQEMEYAVGSKGLSMYNAKDAHRERHRDQEMKPQGLGWALKDSKHPRGGEASRVVRGRNNSVKGSAAGKYRLFFVFN